MAQDNGEKSKKDELLSYATKKPNVRRRTNQRNSEHDKLLRRLRSLAGARGDCRRIIKIIHTYTISRRKI